MDLTLPLAPLSVSVESPTGKPLIVQSARGEVKGTVSISLRVPSLLTSMCGWVKKMSDGLLTKGSYKKRWVVLIDNVLSYYEDPFTLDECKGKLRLVDITEIMGVKGSEGVGIRLISDDANNVWTLAWDPEEPKEIRCMWSRKLFRCLPSHVNKCADVTDIISQLENC